VSERFICKVECVVSNPSLETMAMLAAALKCTVSDLLPADAAVQAVSVGAEDMRRAQEALAVLRSVLTIRKRARKAAR
jgi:transcriptional regulator with XRE-family HTH domain